MSDSKKEGILPEGAESFGQIRAAVAIVQGNPRGTDERVSKITERHMKQILTQKCQVLSEKTRILEENFRKVRELANAGNPIAQVRFLEFQMAIIQTREYAREKFCAWKSQHGYHLVEDPELRHNIETNLKFLESLESIADFNLSEAEKENNFHFRTATQLLENFKNNSLSAGEKIFDIFDPHIQQEDTQEVWNHTQEKQKKEIPYFHWGNIITTIRIKLGISPSQMSDQKA